MFVLVLLACCVGVGAVVYECGPSLKPRFLSVFCQDDTTTPRTRAWNVERHDPPPIAILHRGRREVRRSVRGHLARSRSLPNPFMSSSSSATAKTSSSKKQRKETPKETRERTTALISAPIVNQVKAQAKAELDDRTSAAVAQLARRTTSIDLSKRAGPWKLHHREGGAFTLSRGLTELIIISKQSDKASDWTVTYEEPIDY